MRAGAGEEELPGESFALHSAPYPRWNGNPPGGPTPVWNAWRLGWWAGLGSARTDIANPFAWDMSVGTLRPSGSQVEQETV